ncbi:MAG: L-rhamnose isomerase [Clostridia bacterium]|nr:L-rhamnose isomerase [Clostridia bacterium]
MSIEKMYAFAKEQYAALGVDVDAAIAKVENTPVSIHCWQGDDVRGFENPDGELSGGIQTTGNYPGRARNIDELRADFDFAAKLIPGKKKLSLHAIYLDNGGKKVERNEIDIEHFTSWVQWAKERGLGLDYNPTCFSHPMADDGFTLSHNDPAVRNYWIEHCIRSRHIAEYFGKELGQRAMINHWVPDGFKDIPVNRALSRQYLADSFDKIFAEQLDDTCIGDAVESKVFGIGAESCTIGSNEFYVACAMKHGKMVTLDTGHFHPTEVVSDKLSAVLTYMKEVMLHVSRPVRWDSDHVVIIDDELKAIANEIARGGYENRVNIGLDFFDASINRIACWAIGSRSMQKALLWAALEPVAMLQKFEAEGDYTSRLAYLEEIKTYPFAAVWDYYCEKQGVPTRDSWVSEMKAYEQKILEVRK